MLGKIIRLIAILVVLGATVIVAWYFITPTHIANSSVSGLIIRSQRWSEQVTVTGDVIFQPWATLTIDPGTTVRFEKDPDIEGTEWTKFADAYIKDHDDPTGREGYGDSHFLIFAKIIAQGTEAAPIVFTSAQADPEYADWDQLVLLEGSRLDYVDLAYAHNGVNVDGNKVTVTNSTIHDSLWSCVDIFSVGNLIENNEIYHCWHQAIGVKIPGANEIRNNTIHDAQLGVNCEHGANPTLTNNSFVVAPLNPDCPTGTGNTEENRQADTIGGTYGGKLIYPAPAFD